MILSIQYPGDRQPTNKIAAMSEKSKIFPCLFEGENDLPSDTPLYRYMSVEAFLYLLEFQRIPISRIIEWPDSYEGTRFEFLKNVKEDNQFSNKNKSDFYVSCWTLQIEERCLYKSQKSFDAGQNELVKNGSAAMWESYCKNGGIRIKTTLGKVESLLTSQFPGWTIYRGRVYYEPAEEWTKTINTPSLISTLLHKRVSFRSESEYRFILVPDVEVSQSRVTAYVDDLYDFLEEILVSPATSSNKWLSRTLYNIVVGLSIKYPDRTSINIKNGQQFCRISQLYDLVSETIGHHDMA